MDLMLEDFEKKIKDHKYTIAKGKKITTYIYSRSMLLNWLRDFTKGRELIRPTATRFATSCLTLSCLNEFKGELMAMFSSEQGRRSKFEKTKEGKRIYAIVMDDHGFWQLVKCLKLMSFFVEPFFGLIHLVIFYFIIFFYFVFFYC